MVIDSHAHIVPEGFVKEVRFGKFGPAFSIQKGLKWELLLTRSTLFGQERVDRVPLPRETFDIELRQILVEIFHSVVITTANF